MRRKNKRKGREYSRSSGHYFINRKLSSNLMKQGKLTQSKYLTLAWVKLSSKIMKLRQNSKISLR